MAASIHWFHALAKNKHRFEEDTLSSFIAVIDTQFGQGECFTSFWQTFQQSSQSQKRCHYTALLDQLPDINTLNVESIDDVLRQELISQWPVAISGYHRLILLQGKLVLTLVVGDRQTALASLAGTFHHLFIHDITSWTIHDMKRLGLMSMVNACCWIDQFSSVLSSWLKEAGFEIDEIVKNTIVTGRYTRQLRFKQTAIPKEKKAIIVGAGLAGTTLCERLTERGWHIDLIESQPAIAQGASGNLGGVFMPMLSKDDNPATQLIRTAFFYAQQLWQQVGGIGHAIDGEQCGVFQVARDEEQEQTFYAIAKTGHYPASYAQYLTKEQATELMGMPAKAGYFFSKGGWLNPPSVCHAMLAASDRHQGNYTLHLNKQVASAVYINETWCVYDADAQLIAQAPTLILANGMEALRFIPSSEGLLQAIWGQVTHIPAQYVPPLPVVLTGDGYLTRPYQGKVSMGATYDKQPVTVSAAGHQDNLTKLQQFLPTISISPSVLPEGAGRVGVRCVTQDRLPVVGAIPAVSAAMSSNNKRNAVETMPGLYGLLGYASRGLIWSPLAAEMLACHLDNEPMPVSKKLWQAVVPDRCF